MDHDYGRDIVVEESFAYIAAAQAGLSIIDVAEPSNPRAVGWHRTDGNAYGIAVGGGKAYVGTLSRGLFVLDISNPTDPFEFGKLTTAGSAGQVSITDCRVYIADGGTGVAVSRQCDPVRCDRAESGGTPERTAHLD